MKEARQVALIEPVGGHGGMSHYDLGLCRGLIQAGWSVSWYTCTESGSPALSGMNFRPVFKGIWGKTNRWKRAARYLLGSLYALLQALLSGQRVCHLHFFNGAPEELMLLVLSRLFARKVVLTVHDVESFAGSNRVPSATVVRLYNLAHRFVVHNETSRRELCAALHVPAKRISVIRHGDYLDALGEVVTIDEARRTLQIDRSRKVILFFGQIKAVKGLDLLLEALPAVTGAIPDVLLLIAGRPWKNDFAQYEQIIQRLDLSSHCRLHIRFIPDSEVALFYAAADLVVLPYRRIYQSGVLLLAMSYGKAVLVSDLPGMTEMITDGSNGFVFATGDAHALSQALIRVLKDVSGREHAAQQALSYIRAQHSWEGIGQQLANLYRSLS